MGIPMPHMALGAGDTICSSVPDCSIAVGKALQLGFRHVDTAYEYGTQVAVGVALRTSKVPRAELFVTTKIPGPVGYNEAIRIHTENLRQLNLSRVDMLLMHYPCAAHWGGVRDSCGGTDDAAARSATWRAMEHLVAVGLAGRIGVSNYQERHLASLLAKASVTPAVNQVEWHLGWWNASLLAYCTARRILLQAYSPLGGGGTTTGHNGGVALDDPVVASIAARHRSSTAVVALRWSLQRGVALVVGTTNPAHMASDLRALHGPVLSSSELEALSALRAAVPSVRIVDAWPDVMMPVVALGTWPGSIHNRSVADAVGAWLRAGGRHVDTAHGYGTEGLVGTAVATAVREGVAARDEIFLTTKVPGPIGYEATLEMVSRQAVPALGDAPIDLVLIHWPCPGYFHGANWSGATNCSSTTGLADRLSTWRALESLRAVGKVRAIGVSNFDSAQLAALQHAVNASTSSAANISVNQVEWHLGHHDDVLLAYCTRAGITLQAYSPLGGSAAAHPDPAALQAAAVKAAASAHSVSVYQVALRWSLQRGVPLVTATASAAHMAADLSPLFRFELSRAQMAALDCVADASSVVRGGQGRLRGD